MRILDAIRFTSYEHKPGDLVDLPGDIAATWCHNGLAELVRSDRAEAPEASEPAQETTATKSRASRARKSD
ncbi:hypothetical protein [Thermoactinospora rubra]|uniref:hypothetical protein n=1 Tax=Thermoactinospora rubra TaxID=1088767 RepID=UPI00117F6D49|nr:hypothetical protein [Thermoactinospora rubra]